MDKVCVCVGGRHLTKFPTKQSKAKHLQQQATHTTLFIHICTHSPQGADVLAERDLPNGVERVAEEEGGEVHDGALPLEAAVVVMLVVVCWWWAGGQGRAMSKKTRCVSINRALMHPHDRLKGSWVVPPLNPSNNAPPQKAHLVWASASSISVPMAAQSVRT